MINKFSIIIVVILGTLLSSCGSEEGLVTNMELGNCLENATPFDFNATCIDSFGNSIVVCETVEIDTLYALNKRDNLWLSSFCLEIGESLVYHNDAGNQTLLTLSNKSYYKTKSTQFEQFACGVDMDESRAYCLNTEAATTTLSSSQFNIDFNVSLSKQFQIDNEQHIRSGTTVKITSLESQGPNLSLIQHFIGIVDPGDLQLANTFGYEFYDEITIQDQTFTNVHSYNNSFDDRAFRMFYNSEFGIVSFIDQNNIQWVLNP